MIQTHPINIQRKKLEDERSSLVREQKEIYSTDHRRNAKRKLDKITTLKSKTLDVPIFLFPENDINAHVVVPNASGYVSNILSQTVDNVVPDDADMDASGKALTYSLQRGTDTRFIEEGILAIADSIKDISGIRVFPKTIA